MPVVPLVSNMSNKAAFVNSLFDTDVRDPSQSGLLTAIASGALYFSYADTASRVLILNAWLAGWQSVTGGSPNPADLARCPAQDLALFQFLAGYLQANAMQLCLPSLTLDGTSSGLAVYRNTGYTRQPFVDGTVWRYGSFDANGDPTGDLSQASVALFLQQIFYGAHMVVIESDEDVDPAPADALDALDDALETRVDLVNSHYGLSGIGTGRYYEPTGAPTPSFLHPDVEVFATSTPPGLEPLAFAFLAGVTASTHRNVFLQLEGWPAQTAVSPPGGARHNADFAANTATLWNFATYGACALSEKRSTPVFLAPADFDLTLHADTGMPYYWGANAGNVGDSWMHPQLVVIGT